MVNIETADNNIAPAPVPAPSNDGSPIKFDFLLRYQKSHADNAGIAE